VAFFCHSKSLCSFKLRSVSCTVRSLRLVLLLLGMTEMSVFDVIMIEKHWFWLKSV